MVMYNEAMSDLARTAGKSTVGRKDRPLVLVFRSSYNEINRRSFDGLYSTVRRRGWDVQTIEYGRATEILRLSSKVGSDAPDVQQLLKFWKPDGCIVERNFGLVELAPRDFGRVPTVFLEGHPSLMPAGAACVYCNGGAVPCASRWNYGRAD